MPVDAAETGEGVTDAGNRSGRWAADPLALPNVRGERVELPRRRPRIHEDLEAARRWLASRPGPRAVDLFSGCGGLGLGLEKAGFSVVAAADADATALETYAANVESLTWCGDLADPEPFVAFLRERGVDRVDLVAGGPPCQPFSRAGSSKIRSLVRSGARAASDERVDLWRSFRDIIDALSPSAVLIENVPDMASWDDGSVLLGILQSLRDRGFIADARVLQADRYGVPQHRQRLFVVARRIGTFAWPRPSKHRVDLEDAIADLPTIEGGDRTLVRPYDEPASDFQMKARQGIPRAQRGCVHDHIARAVREDDREAFESLRPGQTYRQLPARLKRYRDDIFDDKYKRLAWDEVSRTITAHIARDGYWYIHPDQPRTLSIREAARIQTFPDRFRFCGYPSVQLRQIGNAVPPALARAVARRVAAALESDSSAKTSDFGGRLRAWGTDLAEPTRIDPWTLLLRHMCPRLQPSCRDGQLPELLRIAPDPATAIGRRDALTGLVGERPASRIQTLAERIVAEHSGRVPSDEAALRGLPGVGTHTAACVRSFGFGERTVLASQGVRRVVERVTGHSTASVWTSRLELMRLAGAEGPDPTFNAALVRLATTVCRPKRPACTSCPVLAECRNGRARTRSSSVLVDAVETDRSVAA